MLMLLAIIELLQSCIARIQRWLTGPSRPRHGSAKTTRPADRHDHRHSPQKPEWLKHEIIRLKALMPQAGCRSIADICNRRFAASRKVTVGKTYVHQILQQHCYEIQILRRNLKHVKPKPVPRNFIWGVDLTGKTDTHGCLHFMFGVIDHGTRALLHLQALHDKTSHTLLACLNEIIRTHGKPKIIRTDCGRVAEKQRGPHQRTLYGCNEAIFTSRTFRLGLKKLGIRHQRTDPGCPWQNGRIERLFGTLKHKLDQWQVANFAQLNRDLQTFRHWYNHIRPHQNLDGRTPAEAWSGCNPYTKVPITSDLASVVCLPNRMASSSIKQEHWFEAWDGLLAGYELRH